MNVSLSDVDFDCNVWSRNDIWQSDPALNYQIQSEFEHETYWEGEFRQIMLIFEFGELHLDAILLLCWQWVQSSKWIFQWMAPLNRYSPKWIPPLHTMAQLVTW